MSDHKQRVRDPIHGLIIFEKTKPIDQLAWKLIDLPEFQRLRRIRQLGMSEFVFPSATHTRFAHSIGVFHNARRLMEVVKRSLNTDFNIDRANEVLIAALLHDIGHGPFSHTFEGAREAIAVKRGHDAIEKHEKFSAKIIRDGNGRIAEILNKYQDGMANSVAAIIESDDPVDIYQAVLSSSFDADRLDFLVRDRYMTGTGTGAIDVQWLIDNLTQHVIFEQQDDDANPSRIPTFVFKEKGRHAAEDFLLARYRLYNQVYLHKTTRGFEKLLSAVLQIIGDSEIEPEFLNLRNSHPLIQFLRNGEEIEKYKLLDDAVLWGVLSDIAMSNHTTASELALRILNREHLHVLDISAHYAGDMEGLVNAIRRVEEHVGDRIDRDVFKDDPPYNLYSKYEGEADKTHKIVRVLDGNGHAKEIIDFNDTIISGSLTKKKRLVRYYFRSHEEKSEAEKAMNGR